MFVQLGRGFQFLNGGTGNPGDKTVFGVQRNREQRTEKSGELLSSGRASREMFIEFRCFLLGLTFLWHEINLKLSD